MRIHPVLAFVGAATLSLSACAEPVVVSPTAAANSTVLVQANANPAYKPAPGEVQDMKGAFHLEDGRTLTLSNNGNKVFAELDGKREELLPVAENRFRGRESGTGVTFNRVPFGDEVVVTPAR
jgi:predicted heme/steroid binding protein